MLFVLKNVLSTFQSAIDIILLAVKGQLALVILDGDVIFLSSVENIWTTYGTVLRPPRKAAKPLKLNKWFFFENRIHYFVFLIHRGRPGISVEATNAIGILQDPGNVTGLKLLWVSVTYLDGFYWILHA